MASYGTSGHVPGPVGNDGMTGSSQNKRLQQTQAQVDEVVDIMRVNVDKVLERDQKLAELDNRADALQDGARQFENAATRLKRKYWWQNLKMWLILIAIVVVIIIIIIVAIATNTPSSKGGSGSSTTTSSPTQPSTSPTA